MQITLPMHEINFRQRLVQVHSWAEATLDPDLESSGLQDRSATSKVRPQRDNQRSQSLSHEAGCVSHSLHHSSKRFQFCCSGQSSPPKSMPTAGWERAWVDGITERIYKLEFETSLSRVEEVVICLLVSTLSACASILQLCILLQDSFKRAALCIDMPFARPQQCTSNRSVPKECS